jgi:hypothetical protein
MEDHAKQNADSYARIIAGALDAYDLDWDMLQELEYEAAHGELSASELEELEELRSKMQGYESKEDAERDIIEMPLSVEVRSGWYAPGSEPEDPEEFCILLSTGGPALRIIGDLDRGEPIRARLQYQDWGTPWTEFFDVDRDTLISFARFFYFR